MTLNESIGVFNLRKSLRFEMRPVAGTADYIADVIADDEDRAAGINAVKDVIQAQHRSMVRRVFKSLPDPIPADQEAIKQCFKNDPEYQVLNDPNGYNLLKTVIDRCRYNKLPIPKAVKDIHGWSALYVKWHWNCMSERSLSGNGSLPSQWAGKSKAEILKTCKVLEIPKKRNPARGRWYDHSPFRMMFDNHAAGMSWLKGDFAASRNVLLLDGERILVAIMPRHSKVNPYTMPRPLPIEDAYLLYEEVAGGTPSFRAIPRALIDSAAHRGTVYLFELTGRGLRGKSNAQAKLLRTLLSQANFDEGVLHLEKQCEFHCRKASFFSPEDTPQTFRQRFTEDKLFITLHLTINAHLVSAGLRPDPFRKVSKCVKANPYARFVILSPAQGGYKITAHKSLGEDVMSPVFVSTKDANSGRLVSELLKCVLEHDVNVTVDKNVPEKIKKAIADKFSYAVIKGRDDYADGGILRGYQLLDRLFVGAIPPTAAELEAMQAAEKAAKEKAKQKKQIDALKADCEKVAAKLRAEGREPTEKELDFSQPQFADGRFKFYFQYKLSDGFMYIGECMANFKNEVFQKLEPFNARPTRVLGFDKAFIEHFKNLQGVDVGSKLYHYKYRTSENVACEGECRADAVDEVYWKLKILGIKPYVVDEMVETDGVLQKFSFTFMNADKVRQSGVVEAASKQDAYNRLHRKGIRPIRVLAEGEEPPVVKKFFKEQKESAPEPEKIYIPAEEPKSETKAAPAPKPVTKPAKKAETKAVPQSPFPDTPSLSIAERLKRLNALKADGLLTEEEYAAQRAKIIAEL